MSVLYLRLCWLAALSHAESWRARICYLRRCDDEMQLRLAMSEADADRVRQIQRRQARDVARQRASVARTARLRARLAELNEQKAAA